MYSKVFKRLIDVVFSLIGLIVLFPVIIILLIFSSIIFKGDIFFFQKRVGYKNKVFTIFKFRTMFNHRDNDGNLLKDEERVNRYGLFLRKFSLDEILQIFNILKGDLSIVGPRPLLVEYLKYYTSEELIRHSVKPGLTGLAQIKGRNSIKWEEKFKYDIYYVQNRSIFLDSTIFFKTIIKVLKGENVSFTSSLIEERIGQNTTLYQYHLQN